MLISYVAMIYGGAWSGLMALYDVSVAFCHAVLDENIYIVPPKGEDAPGIGWQLRKALYGTRRASFLFQNYVMEVLVGAGFVRIRTTVQVFWQPVRKILCLCHGDDFGAGGEKEQLDWLDVLLNGAFLLKILPRVGHAAFGGTESEKS